ncbi:methyltransferase-like protein 22 [Asterias rubens]|uniref:methyltransferase-like protein 22 n=1 Tax=Asterias rubens TaxID=7604 RepID=UPI00145560D8|nr:methyltransferase-like protein 22 [Asterias rubens]
MCEPGEQVLSDVHVDVPISSKLSNKGKATTRFYFRIPVECSDRVDRSSLSASPLTAEDHNLKFEQPSSVKDGTSITEATLDEDGDLVVLRKDRRQQIVVIEHAMATTINEVGLQVWQGCLLLCDFMLSNQAIFRGQVALELGAGVGLGSIVMATMASTVFCTDIGLDVLKLCQRNVTNNCKFSMNNDPQEDHDVKVRELDWFQFSNTTMTNCSSVFQWGEEDKVLLQEVMVIIAADVIYDDELTDAFFNTLHHLMTTGKEKMAFIAIEKRFNFTVDDLKVTCKAYDHFLKHITRLVSSPAVKVKYYAEKLRTDFMECSQYTRTKQMELWEIRAVRSGLDPD